MVISGRFLGVFIADDSAFIRSRLSSALAEIPGVEVIGQAKDGLTAVEAIRALRPDVAILDLRMPGKSGFEALQELRAGHKKLVLIIMTNFPFPQYREKCFALKADYFFDKASDLDKMLAVIRRLGKKFAASGKSENRKKGPPSIRVGPKRTGGGSSRAKVRTPL